MAVTATLALSSGCASVGPEALSNRYEVEIHDPDKAFGGTTVFGDTSDSANVLVVEVDMAGKVVWSYSLPASMVSQRLDGRAAMDVNWLPERDSFLLGVPFRGIYEVNRAKEIVWSYQRETISHDVDRLPNGNTLGVWAGGADSSDPEVFEIDRYGNVVWQWHAQNHLAGLKRYLDKQGYTHTNSVVRLRNGNTLISLRNFYMLIEVDRAGAIVWKLENLFTTPHDPEELANGNILVNTRHPQVLREYDRSGRVVWEHFPADADTIRYNHKLPNGNIIFVERRKIVEITPDGETVWQLRVKDVGVARSEFHRWLYKAERIPLRGERTPSMPAIAPPASAWPGSAGAAVPGPRGLTARQVITKNDRDGDGQISESEFQGSPAQFRRLDANDDGLVSHDEIEARWRSLKSVPVTGEIRGPRGLSARQVIANNDSDGDGRVSRSEFGGSVGQFRRLDKDGDGFVTREEFEALWSTF